MRPLDEVLPGKRRRAPNLARPGYRPETLLANVLWASVPVFRDRCPETSYGRTHDLLHGDGPPCPRSAGHGGGGINSIVVGHAASSQTLASFPVTLFSTSARELER